MTASGEAAYIGFDTQRETVLFSEAMSCEGIEEQGASCMRYVVFFEHLPGLLLGPASLPDLQRIVIAAACHVLLADPAVDQRF